jgi:hypothetical protein
VSPSGQAVAWFSVVSRMMPFSTSASPGARSSENGLLSGRMRVGSLVMQKQLS